MHFYWKRIISNQLSWSTERSTFIRLKEWRHFLGNVGIKLPTQGGSSEEPSQQSNAIRRNIGAKLSNAKKRSVGLYSEYTTNYIGIIIGNQKDPHKPPSIME